MYNSPIELVVTDIQHQILQQQDEEVYQAVLHFVPNVDKEELLRALRYDRDQYDKGYLDGKADAMESIVRCKDCKRYSQSGMCNLYLNVSHEMKPDDFCSYGERREGE